MPQFQIRITILDTTMYKLLKTVNMKAIVISVLFMSALAFTSCDKGKDCICTTTYSDGTTPDLVETVGSMDKTTNPDCEAINESTDTYTKECVKEE